MVVLVSFHQVLLLIFNDLVQTHLAVGWKASEITDSCRFDENRCLGGEGQDTRNSSLWEGEPGGFSSLPSVCWKEKQEGKWWGTPKECSGPVRNVGLLELKGRDQQGT